MRATLHYVKGHMGGNLIALLWSEDTEDEIGLEVLLRAIDILDVHEAGGLIPSEIRTQPPICEDRWSFIKALHNCMRWIDAGFRESPPRE